MGMKSCNLSGTESRQARSSPPREVAPSRRVAWVPPDPTAMLHRVRPLLYSPARRMRAGLLPLLQIVARSRRGGLPGVQSYG
jgi:hypothetical protein